MLTPKQEAFCLSYMETGNASEAYRRAYDAKKMKPETVNRAAKELADHPKISARMAELQAEAKERAMVTVESLTRELEEARLLAMQEASPAPAVAATMGKAKLHGLLTDKTLHGSDPDNPLPTGFNITFAGKPNAG